MKSSENFFNVVAPLFAIVIFAMGFILSIVAYNTVNWLAAGGVFLLGIVLMVLFFVGINIWNERMYGETVDKAKTALFRMFILGVCILIVGCFSFKLSPTTFAINCLAIGATLIVVPVIIAAVCGLIRYISDRIWIYRMLIK